MSSLNATFEVLSLDDLVLLFSANRVTGRLQVGGEQACDLWLVDGCFSYARRPDEADTIDEVEDPAELTDRIVEALFPLLLVPDAGFDFLDGDRDPSGSPVRLPVADALTRARERLENWKAIAASIPSLEAVAGFSPLPPPGVEQVTIGVADWPIAAMIDGRRDVADLVRDSGRSAYDVCLALHHLLAAGVVRLG